MIKNVDPFWWEDYKEYLKSSYWKRFAHTIRRERGFKCEECNGRGWQIHHLSYPANHQFNEDKENVKLLCEKCHENFHGK